MSKNHWADQTLLLNLTTPYIFFGISTYLSYFRLQLPQSPQYKLLKEFPFPLVPIAPSPEQPGNPELGAGSSAMWGCTKRKLLYLLPLVGVSDPKAACTAAGAGSQVSWLQPVLCCQLLEFLWICLPKLPPTRPQAPLRASEALQELWGI